MEAISLMKQLVQNKMITIRVVDKKENSSVVEIADESVTPIINVSKHLLESGYAVKDSKDVLTINETVNTVKEVNGKYMKSCYRSWFYLYCTIDIQ